jgi:hypothetical protein
MDDSPLDKTRIMSQDEIARVENNHRRQVVLLAGGSWVLLLAVLVVGISYLFVNADGENPPPPAPSVIEADEEATDESACV